MFDKLKFKKNYPLLVEFVSNKEVMKVLLNNTDALDFYKSNEAEIEKLISKLKELYSKEKVYEIIITIIKDQRSDRLEKLNEGLSLYIQFSKQYHNDLEPIKDLDLDTLSTNESVIEEDVLNSSFKMDYKGGIDLRGRDVGLIYRYCDDLKIKRQLYTLLQKGNLDLFAAMSNQITIDKKNTSDINKLLFEEEIDDVVYSKETEEALGEEYKNMINYFFNRGNKKDRELITAIIKSKNYKLLKELTIILTVERRECIRNILDITEVNNSLIDLPKLRSEDLRLIVLRNITDGYLVDTEMIGYSYMVKDREECTMYYREHQELIEISKKLDYVAFGKLSKELKRKLYEYSQTINDNERKLIIEEIKKINKEVTEWYKEGYKNKINSGQGIVDKAEDKVITDSRKERHRVKVYDLKDEEPFAFLITVMRRGLRESFQNAYGRPSHTQTVDDPSSFLKEHSNGSTIISASLINQHNINTFVADTADVMYVFSDIQGDDILSICQEDGHFAPDEEKDPPLFREGRPKGPNELVIGTRMYNEIAIKRKRNGEKIKPTAIVCYDKINDDSIKHAEYFDIPIIVIHTKTYHELKDFTQDEEKGYIY